LLILPAIDLRGGQCVRLRQGDYAQETVFNSDPIAVARHWVAQGADYLHLVDLDGAKAGAPVNGAVIAQIVAAAGVPCQLGGGLRTDAQVQTALAEWGVARVIIGTAALERPAWLEQLCARYPQRIVLGLDARDGQVATAGWLNVSAVRALDLARQVSAWPLAAIVYTDIRRDGMLQGPNVPALAEMAQAVSTPVIASGGVTTLADYEQLCQLPLGGVIIGRALYEGQFDLRAALRR
jgi:phosphoribosylformimino-5-aminoimidazole carboxamide ribotide isomerase